MSATTYVDSKNLLTELAEKDSSFDWEPISEAATDLTDSRVLAVSSGPTLREQRTKHGERLLEQGQFVRLALVIPIGFIATVFIILAFNNPPVLLQFAPEATLLFFSFIPSFRGHVLLARARSNREDNKTVVLPPLVDIEPVVPSPISYKLRSRLGPEGELLAYLTRSAPEIVDSGLRNQEETFGPIHLGSDEDSSELSETFEALLADVEELEQAAAIPHARLLTEHHLAEMQLPETKAKLRRRVERARDRLQLNSGIVSSLNEQNRGKLLVSAPEV